MLKKKTLLIIPVFLISLFISLLTPIVAAADDSNYEPRLTAPDSSISYYSKEKNVYFKTGTPMPNCVAYAYGRIYEMNGEKPLITHGSAGDWYFMNKNNRYYEYGQEPRLGAIACWSNHVAIVEAFDETSVTVSESHWGGSYFDTKTFSDMHSHYGQTFYGYIYAYNNGITKKLENELINAEKEKNAQYKQEEKIIITPESTNEFNIIKLEEKPQLTVKDPLLEKIL